MNARLQALRGALEQRGFDGFVSICPPDNQYLTGFQGSTSGVIVGPETALFLCDFRYAEQALDQVSGSYSVQEFKGNLATRLAEKARDAGMRNAAFEPAVTSVAELSQMESVAQGVFKPAPGLLSKLRQVKDDGEIERVRAAQRLTCEVMAEVTEAIELGITERQLAASIEYAMKRRGASGAAFDTIALFGSRSSLPHGQPGEKLLEEGDVVLLDFGCRLDGYCADLTRTYAFGTIPGTWFEEVYDLVLTAQRIALEAVRPGMTARELDADARDLINEAGHGDRFRHGLGHGVGIEVHEGPRLNSESEAILEPGMVITIEPGIYLPGRGGVRIEDLVVVTQDGCENLTVLSKEMKVLV